MPNVMKTYRVRFYEPDGEKRRCTTWFSCEHDDIAVFLAESKLPRLESVEEVDPTDGKTICTLYDVR